MQYAILHNHTHGGSLLDAISKPKDIVQRCIDLGITACAMTDHGSISAAVDFLSECKKKSFKGILGVELYITKEKEEKAERDLSHLIVLSKNLQGWKSLIKLVTESNQPENFYYKPRLTLEKLKKYCKDGNLICVDGHLGSCLSEILFTSVKEAAKSESEEEVKKYINKEWVADCTTHINYLQEIFGKENVFLEIQLFDSRNIPATKLLARGYRYLGKKLDVKCVAGTDAHYCNKEDATLQRIVLANSVNRTLKDLIGGLSRGEDIPMAGFFKSSQYYIPSGEELLQFGNTQEELNNNLLVASMCESYDITGRPILPSFDVPDGKTSAEYLKELCRIGWTKKQDKINDVMKRKGFTKEDYAKRFQTEYDALIKFGLADYFLIVWDIFNFVNEKGILCGPGRGSSAGSLILYLLDVTKIDPLEYNLLFERFWNEGRSTKDRVSMPDIDMDFEIERRDEIMEYIKDKYTRENVAQICTFGALKGRMALYDTLRAFNATTPDEIHRITKSIPDEAEISDELQNMKERGENPSIIMWSLENRGKDFSAYCSIGEDGSLIGPMSKYFEYAIKLENTFKSRGKHAAGICISNKPISDMCPMIYDNRGKQMIAGFDMDSIDRIGLLKYDVLGVAALSKLHTIVDMVQHQQHNINKD